MNNGYPNQPNPMMMMNNNNPMLMAQQQQQRRMNNPMNRQMQPQVFDGKRKRQHIERKYVDFSGTIVNDILETRFQRSSYEEPPNFIPPHPVYSFAMLPSYKLMNESASNLTTRFTHASTNKNKCAINTISWTPEGRRLITGAATGEFTLWNGTAFNFETILQAHTEAIRAMIWSHSDTYMVTADNKGSIKYWQSNMNNLKHFEGHTDICIRDLSFSPSDLKFSSAADDGTVKIWDFETSQTELKFTGHGSDVKCCDWHPTSSLIATGAKDYLLKLWDAKSGQVVSTLHGHKNVVYRCKWNKNGNWLLTCSKDQLIKCYDVRYMKDFQTFKGAHGKEVVSLAWHPFQENLFASGGYEGSIMMWLVGNEQPQAKLPTAHESAVWDLRWHPMGHILASGSNDQTTKFWIRNRPGDAMIDNYNGYQMQENVGQGFHLSQVVSQTKPTIVNNTNAMPTTMTTDGTMQKSRMNLFQPMNLQQQQTQQQQQQQQNKTVPFMMNSNPSIIPGFGNTPNMPTNMNMNNTSFIPGLGTKDAQPQQHQQQQTNSSLQKRYIPGLG